MTASATAAGCSGKSACLASWITVLVARSLSSARRSLHLSRMWNGSCSAVISKIGALPRPVAPDVQPLDRFVLHLQRRVDLTIDRAPGRGGADDPRDLLAHACDVAGEGLHRDVLDRPGRGSPCAGS